METTTIQSDATAVNEEVSFTEIFFRYLRYWKWFVASVLLCLGIAFIYLKYTTKEYTVLSKVLIKDQKGQTPMDITVFSDLGLTPRVGSFDNEIEILLAHTLRKEVTDSLELGVSYWRDGKIKQEEVYKNTPVFVTVSNQTETGSFILDREAGGKYSITSESSPRFVKKFDLHETFNTPWGILSFRENPFGVADGFPVKVTINDPTYLPDIQITPINKMTTVVTVSTITSVPQKGIDIINTLIATYNKKAVGEKNYVATNTIHFIDERLKNISGELQFAEQNVENYQRSVGGVADPSAKAPIFMSEVSGYSKRISDAQVQLEILRNIRRFLVQPENRTAVAPANLTVTDPTILSLINRYNEEILEKARNTSGMTADNNRVKEYDDRIALLKDNLIKGINIAEGGMETQLRELTKKENEYELKTLGLATQERESRDLFRQKEIKEALYTYLLQKREETWLSMALATPNAIVIDAADYSPIPVKPKNKIILLAALILGVMIPVAVVYILDLFDTKLRFKDQLTQVVKAPFLGDVLQSKSDKPFPVLSMRSAIAEKFYIIASNLGFIVPGDKSRVVMVTSSYSGEGKSFFSKNLAMSLANSGNKTLLIDMDMRKSEFFKTLNLTKEKGIAMYLADPKITVDEIIDRGKSHKNLDIIVIKQFPPNPAELLSSSRLDLLFQTVAGEYDYIIVDTAPIGLVADAFRINQFADATIYVTRSDYTYKSTLPEIQLLYRDGKLRNMTTVINGMPITRQYGYNDNRHNYYTEEEN